MKQKVALRAAQAGLLAAVMLLPLAVHTVPLYLACAAPCVAGAGALGYWDASRRRR